MGLFGTIFKGIVGAVRGGISAIAGRTPRQVALAQRLAPAARSVAGGVAGGLAVEAGSRLLTSLPHPGTVTQAELRETGRGGNGQTFRTTHVHTVEVGTGRIVRTEVLRGTPFIMRNDIQIAKRVIRTATKLGRLKGMRHTVRPSNSAKLKAAIEQKALDQVLAGGKC